MADIFLSYKREDQQVARGVATDLEAEGFSVFFDVNIEVGDSWDETIERELKAAKAVVVLWSPRSCDSKWVRREAREATARRALSPAIIARCKVPLEFNDVQAADLIGRRSGDRSHAEWRRLCSGLSRHIGRAARGPESAKEAPGQTRSAVAFPRTAPHFKKFVLPNAKLNLNLSRAVGKKKSGLSPRVVLAITGSIAVLALATSSYFLLPWRPPPEVTVATSEENHAAEPVQPPAAQAPAPIEEAKADERPATARPRRQHHPSLVGTVWRGDVGGPGGETHEIIYRFNADGSAEWCCDSRFVTDNFRGGAVVVWSSDGATIRFGSEGNVYPTTNYTGVIDGDRMSGTWITSDFPGERIDNGVRVERRPDRTGTFSFTRQ